MKKFLVILFVLIAHSVFAQNATTIGTLTLTPTFDNIGVRFTYTGDANTNNTAILQYRLQGSSTWLDAHTTSIASIGAEWPDRRATASGTTNIYNNQYRASIVGLTGAIYEVQLTISDVDGVSGVNPAIGTVTLLSTSTLVVQSGTTKYLDTNAAGGGDGSTGTPYNTWANAQSGTSCGDTLFVKANSTVTGVTFTKSCSSSTWYVIQCDNNTNTVFAEGSGTTPNLTISGDYVKVDSCHFGSSSDSVILASSTPTFIWYNNNYLENAGTAVVAAECNSSRYGEASMEFSSGAHDIFITNNQILSPYLTATAECATPWNSSLSGIWFNSPAGRIIIKGNNIDGGYRDSIAASPESCASFPCGTIWDDTDILNNTFKNPKDDGPQPEGQGSNVRIGGNIYLPSATGNSCFSTQTTYVGPLYEYRNYCEFSSVHAGAIWKMGGTEGAYFFHNTVKMNVASGGPCGWCSSGGTNTIYITAQNNILQFQSGDPLYHMYSTGAQYDYNQYYKITGGAEVANGWDGSTTYSTPAAFCSGASQECHGQAGNPNLDASLHITNTSPAHDVGRLIGNFNDLTSAWPYSGIAPDMGAFEVQETIPANGTPLLRLLHR